MESELPPPVPPVRVAGPAETPADDAPPSICLPHPVALSAVATVIGLVSGLAGGFLVGGLAFTAGSNDCSPQDGWCELGAAVIGLVIGVGVGVVAYLTAGVMTIVRCRPAGRRAPYVFAHLGIPFALLALSTLIGAIQS